MVFVDPGGHSADLLMGVYSAPTLERRNEMLSVRAKHSLQVLAK